MIAILVAAVAVCALVGYACWRALRHSACELAQMDREFEERWKKGGGRHGC